MKRALCAWLLSVAPLISFGAAASDSKAVEGAWTPVKAELAGQELPEAVLKTISLKLHEGKYEVFAAGQPDKGTYTIDASARPKRITITGTEGPNSGKTIPAIYELQGETLRVCYDLSGKKHPGEFKTEAGTRLYLATYSRRKE